MRGRERTREKSEGGSDRESSGAAVSPERRKGREERNEDLALKSGIAFIYTYMTIYCVYLRICTI